MTIDDVKAMLPTSSAFIMKFEDTDVSYTSSKLGGNFYWPDENYPKGYIFLVQINFAELPKNEIFPKEGLLQFFIKDDDFWGLDSNDGYKVVYHKEIKEGVSCETFCADTPISKTAKITFELTTEYLSASDYRFDEIIDLDTDNPEEDAIYEHFFNSGCNSKLLGFPVFCQFDPRDNGHNERYNQMLLQLDSSREYMMWGDMGVANFFINREDLKNMNFEDILYNWDCY